MGESRPPRRHIRRVIVGQTPTDYPPVPQPSAVSQSVPTPSVPQTNRPTQTPRVSASNVRREHVEKVTRELQEQTGKLHSRVQQIGEVIEARRKEDISNARENKEKANDAAREMQRTARSRVEDAFAIRNQTVRHDLVQRIDQLAPGMQSASLESLEQIPVTDLTGFIRVGALRVADLTLAALVPFFCRSHWFVDGSSRQSHELILNSLIRLLPAIAIKHLQILVFDPRIEGDLSVLSSLRSVNATTFPRAFSDPDQFNEVLKQAILHTADNVERMAVRGHRNLLDFWKDNDVPEGIATIAIILDHPYGITDELAKTLARISDSNPGNGLTLVIDSDPALGAINDPFWQSVAEKCEYLQIENNTWSTPRLSRSDYSIVHDGPASPHVVSKVIDYVREVAAAIEGPTFPLADLIAPSIKEPWKKMSVDSLDAIIGRTGRDDLVLSFRSENPPLPNLLIGGAVGQGKSNLLLDVIYSLALDYSPNELEMHLLDFKQGLEFKRFDQDENGEGWLPHVRSLSLESNQEFGVAVLRHVVNEYQRRSDLFKKVGVTSISEYRKTQPDALPRLLLIIDEFHVLFDGENDLVDEAVALLESLARLGRAYGIHLLLASQTTSGISGLRSKGEGIFAQFPLRMSLKNTAQESEAILSHNNRAAATLTYRGEVILNENYGLDPEGSNIRGVAAWVEPGAFARIQKELWEQSHDEPPLVFIGSAYAQWDPQQLASLIPQEEGIAEFWVGRPIAISNKPVVIELDSDTDQAIALIGTGEEVAGQVLVSGISTMLKTLEPTATLTFLNGLREIPPAVQKLIDQLRAINRDVEIIDRRSIPNYLVNTLAPHLESDDISPRVIVGLGIQRIPMMDKTIEKTDSDNFDFDFDAPSLSNGTDVIRFLMTNGALNNKYFIGWWSSLQGLTNTAGFGHPGVGTYITLRIGIDDLREVAGPTAQPFAGSPRAGVYQRTSDEGLLTAVPFGDLPPDMWDKNE